MSRGAADAAVGMMDAAYFVGRKELLDFFNDLLDLKLTKIEETASGAIACQLTELVFPGSIPLSRIDWGARSDYEFVQNYKLLQNAFNKHQVQRHVDVEKLIRAKYQDNLEFCQWLKAFYDHAGVYRENYNAQAARAKGKGGKQFNLKMGGSGGGASRARAKPTNFRSNVNTMNKTSTAAPANDSRESRPLRERSSAENDEKPSKGLTDEALLLKNEELAAMNEELIDKTEALGTKTEALTVKNEELELAVAEVEKERDFYFEKLRNVEVMLQVYQEKESEGRDPDHLVDNIFKILYAVAEDNLAVNEDGEVVPASELNESLADSV